jgi:hypothetical protein
MEEEDVKPQREIIIKGDIEAIFLQFREVCILLMTQRSKLVLRRSLEDKVVPVIKHQAMNRYPFA